MSDQEGLPEPLHHADEDEDLVGFAALVAEIALSFLDEINAGPAGTLVEQIVDGAVRVIPGTTAAAVENVDEHGRLHAPIAVGDDVARFVMDAQNDTGEGPSLDALRDNKQIVSDNLGRDPRWPLFSARAAEVGIQAMICTPMEAAARRVGVLTLMSRDVEFVADDDTPTMATVFAAHAAVAMTGASRVAKVVANVSVALTSRDVIGQAKGILIERFKVTPDVAFAMLVRASSVTNLKLRDVSNELCRTGLLLPDPPRASRLAPGS